MRLNHSQIFIKEAQEKHLYEYSVIRCTKVEREEFSMGIIVFAKKRSS
jgi:hypothetical protein